MLEKKQQSLKVPFIEEARSSNVSVTGEYDPYKNPPSLQAAKDHAKAKRVGKIPSESYGLRICPCCQNIINNQEFQLGVETKEFIQLGIGYPLFYEIYKYAILLIGIILVVSGGAFYFFITKDCAQQCYYFLGFVIINLDISAVQTVKRTTSIYAVTGFILFFSCIFIKKKINQRIFELQQTTINPSQYSILIQNLPQNTTTKQIQKWSNETFHQNPIETHIIYDSNELLDSLQNKNNLMIELNQQQIRDQEMIQRRRINQGDSFARQSHIQAVATKQNILKRIEDENKIIQRYNKNYKSNHLESENQSERYPWTGSCILTFNSSQTVDNILNKHQHSTVGYLTRSLVSLFTSDSLKINDNKIVVCKAPQPRQLLWKNMGFSFIRDFIFQILFLLVMIALMALAFKVQFAFVDYAFQQYNEHHINFAVMFQAFIMSFIIVCLNYLLRLIIKFLASINKPHSYTQQQSRFCNQYTLVFILNACLTIYIVHGVAIKGNNQLLIYDIHLVMLTTALSGPLYKILNPRTLMKAAWKYYICKIPLTKNPYTQEYVNKLFEGQEASNADNYQYVYRTLFINVWFASIAPLGMFFTLIIMVADYWITKYMLVKINCQSKILSIQISKALFFLQLIPLIYIVGIFPFILKISTTLSLEIFINQFYTYGVVLVVLLIMVVVYLTIFYRRREFIPPMSYRQIQLGFLHNYETENPLTRLSGQINYLEKLLQSNKLKQSEIQVVKNAIQSNKGATEVMTRKVVGLNRIKHKIQRRIINQVNRELKKQYGVDFKILNSNKKIKFSQENNSMQKEQYGELSPMKDLVSDQIQQTQLQKMSRLNIPSQIVPKF